MKFLEDEIAEVKTELVDVKDRLVDVKDELKVQCSLRCS